MTTISLLFEIAATVSNNFSPTALTVLKPVIAPDSTCRLFFLLYPSVLIPNIFRVPEAEEKIKKHLGELGLSPGLLAQLATAVTNYPWQAKVT